MSPLPVGTTVSYINRAAPGPEGEAIIMFAGIGPGGTGTADVLEHMDSLAKAQTWFGSSQGTEAAIEYFDRRTTLRQRTKLYGFGLDTTGWTANTWTLTFTGTATASGTRWLRLGSYTLAVPIANGADPTAQAVAVVDEITAAAASIPFTASNLAGVVTITSTHVGVSASRIPITIDQFAGENGVPSTTAVLVNNVDATGEPASLTEGQRDEIRKQLGAVWWANIERGSTWIADLEAEIQAGWGDQPGTGLNRYAHAFQPVATDDEATFTTFAAKNLRRFSFAAIGNANTFELSAAIGMIATVVRARLTPNPAAASGFKKNPGMVRIAIEGLRAGTLVFDSKNVEDAGGIYVRNVNGAAIADRFVTNRIKNSLGQPDLSEYQLAGILARRELLERLGGVLRAHEGDTIVSDGGPAGATFISPSQLRSVVETLMVAMLAEGIVLVDDAAAARGLIESIVNTTDVNIVDGWLVTLSAPITKVTSRLEGVAYTS